jgi:hypothetical protein
MTPVLNSGDRLGGYEIVARLGAAARAMLSRVRVYCGRSDSRQWNISMS